MSEISATTAYVPANTDMQQFCNHNHSSNIPPFLSTTAHSDMHDKPKH